MRKERNKGCIPHPYMFLFSNATSDSLSWDASSQLLRSINLGMLPLVSFLFHDLPSLYFRKMMFPLVS